jgi:hypothetical protein
MLTTQILEIFTLQRGVRFSTLRCQCHARSARRAPEFKSLGKFGQKL